MEGMTEERSGLLEQTGQAAVAEPEITQSTVENLVYMIHGQQVMLDSDLARLYQVETKALNRAMKRNIKRFPEDFCFQLTAEEYESLRCQIGTSKKHTQEGDGRGGRRTLPYVFTEQGISMLASVLHSDVAVAVSIGIMRAFVEMRRFIAGNALLFERINTIELKQLEYQKHTEEKFEEIFEYIAEHEESLQKVFFSGQIYDAFSLLASLIGQGEKELILVDNYVDLSTLNLLAKKKEGVPVFLYTSARMGLSKMDVEQFNRQYPQLRIRHTEAFHDRFLIVDRTCVYHIGASLKDAGKKCFGINRIEDERIIRSLLQRLGMGKAGKKEG